VVLVRRGTSAAFETLVARYHTRLLAFCRHMLGSHEDAEDVLQEAFAAAYNAMLADERPINVRPWLYRIARNRCLNHLRKAQAVGVDSMDVHLSEHGATTADKVHSREDFRALLSDIAALPESQRTALVLREMEALSYEQIAEAMETTIPSVKSLLVRARVSLAEASEARQLTCDEVRLELGQIAEGLLRKPTPPVRRHLRACQRCDDFQGELKKTNKALAALLPIGPFVLLHKVALTHLGHSAGSSAAAGSGLGASTATGAGAAAGTSAAAGTGAVGGVGTAAGGTALGSSAAAGSAVAAGSGASGLVSAGVGALATKAAAGLAAAALMTAGAVAVSHAPHKRATQPTVDMRALIDPVTNGVAAGAAIGTSLGAPAASDARSRAKASLAAKRRAALRGAADSRTPATTPAGAAKPSGAAGTASQGPGRTATTPIATVLPPSNTVYPVGAATAPASGGTSALGPTDLLATSSTLSGAVPAGLGSTPIESAAAPADSSAGSAAATPVQTTAIATAVGTPTSPPDLTTASTVSGSNAAPTSTAQLPPATSIAPIGTSPAPTGTDNTSGNMAGAPTSSVTSTTTSATPAPPVSSSTGTAPPSPVNTGAPAAPAPAPTSATVATPSASATPAAGTSASPAVPGASGSLTPA
jgi:RNA polymerase sigma factor (sigma-70 family)